MIGDAASSYMIGNFEGLTRLKLGLTIVHINNGDYAGYGPGFWGEGHDPCTYDVSGPEVINMSAAIKEIGWQTERVTEPSEVIPALERAFAANQATQKSFLVV